MGVAYVECGGNESARRRRFGWRIGCEKETMDFLAAFAVFCSNDRKSFLNRSSQREQRKERLFGEMTEKWRKMAEKRPNRQKNEKTAQNDNKSDFFSEFM